MNDSMWLILKAWAIGTSIPVIFFIIFFRLKSFYRKKEKLSIRDNFKPSIDCQDNTENENDVLSDEIQFTFEFDSDGFIIHVWGGKDSTDAYWAKRGIEEPAEINGITPQKYAKQHHKGGYDSKSKKVTILYKQDYINGKRNGQP